MKQVLYSLIVFAVLFTACKKEAAVTPSKPAVYSEPDFALIPTKNAKWYIHTQGHYQDLFDDMPWAVSNTHIGAYDVDTAVHIYTTIEALGNDTIIDGYTYHFYSYWYDIVNNLDTTMNESYKQFSKRKSRLLLREDTLAKKVYSGHNFKREEEKFYTVLDFSDTANTSRKLKPCLAWPEMNIVPYGDWYVAGYKLKTWNMQNAYDSKYEYFYKAIGIGSITGILPFREVADNWGQVRSLDFVYKGDSIHFDFPLH